MIPAWPIIKTFLGALPWRNILIAAVIGGVIGTIGLYIRSAEKAKAAVETLTTQNKELVNSNNALEKSYKNRLNVLEESIQKNAEREKAHANAIETIKSMPDSGCARVSQPIRASLRLLRANP